jgi:hypothetical protein
MQIPPELVSIRVDCQVIAVSSPLYPAREPMLLISGEITLQKHFNVSDRFQTPDIVLIRNPGEATIFSFGF